MLLGVLSLAAFLTSGVGTGLAPFLVSMSRDLETDLAAVANLVAIQSVPWGLMSLLAGAASDRVGRRPLLVAGLLALGSSQVGVALAGSYPVLALWELLGGFGGGCYMGTVFATVSDRVPPQQRGRALGWVVTGQSLSLVIGVPLITYLGSLLGWRGALGAQGLALLVAVLAVWLVVPRRAAGGAGRGERRTSLGALLNARVLPLLGASWMERVCFGSMAVFLATYLLTAYGVSLQELAGGLGLVALGNLGGNLLGSQLTDRLPARPLVYAATSVGTGLLAVPLFFWQPGLAVSLGLGFAYALVDALGRPALLAALSNVPSELRGTVLGLNVTGASLGWLTATGLGGLLITGPGFGALGWLCLLTGLVGALLACLSWLADRRPAGPAG